MSLLDNTLIGSSAGMPCELDGSVGAHIQRNGLPFPAANQRAVEIEIISHELRNSLGVVRNAARLLRLQAGADGIERARMLIERHVGQMNRHIEDLLDPSPLGRRNEALRLAHMDLRPIVKNSLDAIAQEMGQRGHTLVVSLPAQPLWVRADGARLEQVFSNLLINAAKYTPDAGQIVVTVERLENQASVSVRDSGIGIEPELLSRIFEMFVQVDAKALCAEGGHGIGLAVVRDLVEMHGGTVAVNSAGLGLGSEFTVLLPWKGRP